MVISRLNYPVNCILLLVDQVSVLSDHGTEFDYFISHKLLINAQIVNLETSLSICLVVLHQLSIQLICSTLQVLDLELFGSDRSIKVLNLKVKDELELFQLLSLLFKLVDLFLTIANKLILSMDLFVKLVGLHLQVSVGMLLPVN